MTVKVVFNHLPAASRRITPAVNDVVRDTAYQIARDANSRAPHGGWKHSKQDLRKSYRAQPDRAAPKTRPTWLAFSPNWYAWLVEFGAAQEPARPHLMPASERGRQKLLRDLGHLESELA